MDNKTIFNGLKATLCVVLLFSVAVSAQIPGKDVHFKKTQVWTEFYTEGATVADVNRDGKMDIMAGARWFEAPSWKPHNIWIHKKFDYTKGYSDSFLNFSADVNQDGFPDLICFDFPGRDVFWFENPAGADVLWKRNVIDSIASNESPLMGDVDGDGKMDLVFGNEKLGQMAWFSSSVKDKQVTWTRHPISEQGSKGVGLFSHGLGLGDVNGDGRKDVMIIGGWWEAPVDRTAGPWTWHEASLGPACAQMITYDFDGDGDADVLSSSAHNYGVWWHEQVIDKDKKSTFITHTIDSTFSESHSIVLVDINNDGSPDFVTGKRYFAHQGEGPGGKEPAVIYWFELVKNAKKKPTWIRHSIDDNSGVGIEFATYDMNKDGLQDIVVGNKKGIFYFEQLPALKK